MSKSDPTDHALAAIASILDQPESFNDSDQPVIEASSVASVVENADGYTKYGPGPVAAMRFKWIVRRESDVAYFVDETIGDGSRPITSGPMSKEEAVRFVDDRDAEAQRRFETIKNEMSGRPAEK